MLSSFHLLEVIEYITFLLLRERCPFTKYVLRVTLDVNFISVTAQHFQISLELHAAVISTWLLTNLGQEDKANISSNFFSAFYNLWLYIFLEKL